MLVICLFVFFNARSNPLNLTRTLLVWCSRENGIARDGALAIAELLQRNATLTQLEVISSLSLSPLSPLYFSLCTSCARHVLIHVEQLYDNEIDNVGAMAIAAALQSNTTLRHLDLGGNVEISAEGARAVAAMLYCNSTLCVLDLSNTSIADAGADSLATVLQQCRTLTSLNVAFAEISPLGLAKIASMLEQNGSLTTLDVSSNGAFDAVGLRSLVTSLLRNATLSTLELNSCSLVCATPPANQPQEHTAQQQCPVAMQNTYRTVS